MKPNIRPLAALITVLSCWLIIATTALIVPGCATLAPGADPLVVRTEQSETTAKSTFDFVLNLDNSDRGFWRTNAPGFHNFCEWLRQPQPAGTNILPRCSAMIWDVNMIKADYKASRASSNTLYTILVTLESALNQASSWSTLVTNSVSH